MYKHVTGWLMSKILDWYCKYSVVITCTVDTLKHILNSDQFIFIKLYSQICVVVECCHRSEDCFLKKKRRKKTITHKLLHTLFKVWPIIYKINTNPLLTHQVTHDILWLERIHLSMYFKWNCWSFFIPLRYLKLNWRVMPSYKGR